MADDLGEKLKAVRVRNKMTQEQVADRLGISLSSYQRYESSKSSIDFQLIVKLARLYNITLDELYHYGDPAKSIVEDTSQSYMRSQKRIDIVVQLDGSENTLNLWVEKLKAINQIL